jgi:hypothetical protein
VLPPGGFLSLSVILLGLAWIRERRVKAPPPVAVPDGAGLSPLDARPARKAG